MTELEEKVRGILAIRYYYHSEETKTKTIRDILTLIEQEKKELVNDRVKYNVLWELCENFNLGSGGCPDALISEYIKDLQAKVNEATVLIESADAMLTLKGYYGTKFKEFLTKHKERS